MKQLFGVLKEKTDARQQQRYETKQNPSTEKPEKNTHSQGSRKRPADHEDNGQKKQDKNKYQQKCITKTNKN